MKYANLENWTSMWKALGCKTDMSDVYESLVEQYSQPHRAYHTLQHIEDCLRELEEASRLTSNKDVVALAIWYHDLVYRTTVLGSDEEASADIALQTIRNLSLPGSLGQEVATLIIGTRHFGHYSDPDIQLLCDIDLAILGQPDERFDEYERQIREEYEWVPEEEFISRHGEILQSFLDRPVIYSTKFFRVKYEEQARRNITGSLAQMGYIAKEV